MILTIDLGTTNIKAALWSDEGCVAVGRAGVATTHPVVGWAEQDPTAWWTAVLDATAAVRHAAPDAYGAVAAIGLSSARQTFVPVGADLRPHGRAIVWSDRRAAAEAAELAAAAGGVDALWRRTGVVLDAGGVAAKLAWLRRHDHERWAASRWFLGPRDLLLARLVGTIATDWTQASATGLYDRFLTLVDVLAVDIADRLPPPLDPATVAGELLPVPANALGLGPGVPVVVGAGDRQCEVLGAGATARVPVVSWGTTANVSVPVAAWPDPMPDGLLVTRAARPGWQLEGGLSAAGSLVAWLGSITGLDSSELMARAAESPPGARGAIALPWLGGARAPWWRGAAHAAFLGLRAAHDASDLARAAIEGVAWEVDRCVRLITDGGATSFVVGGGGAGSSLWSDVLSAITGFTAVRRASVETALTGAALLAADAIQRPLDIEQINPVVTTIAPDPALVSTYAALRDTVTRTAEAVIGLAGPVG